MSKLLLSAENVSMGYPDTTVSVGMFRQAKMGHKLALKNVSLELREGENIALVGSNGSGKSTLLQVLAGVFPASTGKITVNGKIQALFNMGIGMKQDLTGRQNAIIMSMISGMSYQEAVEIIPEIFDFAELKNVMDQPVRTYSRGMGMRLSFAVATCIAPEILLIDEWIGAGDQRFRLKAEKRLQDMVLGSNGFILASHNANIVRQYCSKAIWLDDGVVQATGSSEDVLEAYMDSVKAKNHQAMLQATAS